MRITGDDSAGLTMRLPERVGGGEVRTLPGADLRRPNEMSAQDQIANALRLLLGK